MTPFSYCMTTYVSAVSIVVSSVIPIPLKLIWNASASAPVGLYSLHSDGALAVGDLVAVALPPPLANRLAERGYLPRNVQLLKRVAALPGQQVCRTGRDIMIDGRFAGAALDRDNRGRELPVWQGCRVIAAGDVFLMNRTIPDSLDGRYFGPIPATAIIGQAIPLYTSEAGIGRFVTLNSPAHAR